MKRAALAVAAPRPRLCRTDLRRADVGKSACAAPAAASFCAPLPALTEGAHSVVVRACNAAGCSADSNAVALSVIVVPSAPTAARIID